MFLVIIMKREIENLNQIRNQVFGVVYLYTGVEVWIGRLIYQLHPDRNSE